MGFTHTILLTKENWLPPLKDEHFPDISVARYKVRHARLPGDRSSQQLVPK